MAFNKIRQISIIKKIVSLTCCMFFLLQQTCLMQALAASTITPKTGTGVTLSGNTYTITPDNVSGSTGFKSYNDFSLGQGDIANLMFGANYSKFVNLVSNQVSINGILNTMMGNNFYNGRAVFVSPNGMVVGANGVLNVGALSVYTPNSTAFSNYQTTINNYTASTPDNTVSSDLSGLTTGNQGIITINGKIFSRDGVDLYSSAINIGGNTTSKASTGIFSGLNYNTYNNAINSNNDAAALFTTLVNTNGINKGTNFANVNGKIVIQAQAATTDGSVANSSVNVQNAYLDGNGININANSNSTYTLSANDAPSNNITSLGDVIINTVNNTSMSTINSNYGAVSPYTYQITGPVSSATVNLQNGAQLVSSDNVNLSASAISNANITLSKLNGSDILYSYGNSTVSKVDVASGASINTSKDLNVSAVSQNALTTALTSANSTADPNDPGDRVIVLNTVTNADTQASLDQGSSISAKDVDVNAVNETNNSISATATASFNQNSNGGYASDGSSSDQPSLGASVVLNDTSINTNATIDTTVNSAKAGNVTVNAQTFNTNSNTASVTAAGNTNAGQSQQVTPSQNQSTIAKLKNIYNTLSTDKNTGTLVQSTDTTQFSGSGSLIVNNSNIGTTAEVGQNANISAKNVTINANTIDLTINNATTSSSSAAFAAGAAIIVNSQDDSTLADIVDGTISQYANVTATDALNINATTEMPWNLSTLELLYSSGSQALSPFSSSFWSGFSFDSLGY